MVTTILAALGIVLAGLEIREDLRRRLRRRRAQLGRLGLPAGSETGTIRPVGTQNPQTPRPPRLAGVMHPVEPLFYTRHRLVMREEDADIVTCRWCDFRCTFVELKAAGSTDATVEMVNCNGSQRSSRSRPPPTSLPSDGIPRLG